MPPRIPEAGAARGWAALAAAAWLAAAGCASPSLDALEGSCEAGDAAACGAALAMADRQCGRADPRACRRLAALQIAGRGGRPDRRKALAAYERACAAGDAEGCTLAGDAHVDRDPSRAERLRRRACELGLADACFVLSEQLRQRPAAAAEADALLRRAMQHYESACAAGDAAGCAGLGNGHRSAPSPDEEKAFRHLREAARLWGRACEAGDAGACFRLAAAYQEGEGIDADDARYRDYAERACRLGSAEACAELAYLYRSNGVRDDDRRVAPLFETACQRLADPRVPCREAAFAYSDGEGVAVDKARAARLFDRACALEDLWSCFKLGTMYEEGDGVSRDPARAAELLQAMQGLAFRVAAVKRSRTAVDPALTAFGMPASSLKPMTAGAGREFVLVSVDAARQAEHARLPVRKVWVVDAGGRRCENHAPGDADFGEKASERREFLFDVPAGFQPVTIRFELGALSLDLPRSSP